MNWIYTISSVVLISIVSLGGIVAMNWNPAQVRKISFYLVSFAVGGLLGDAYIHLLPESFSQMGVNLKTSLYSLLGILIFFSLEKFLRWRHHHIPRSSEFHPAPMVIMNLIGDAVHNFLDGVLIGASYLARIPIGISTTVAVLMHEIPQEIGDFAILIHGGLSIRKAIKYNLLSALSAIIGALIPLILGSYFQFGMLFLLPVTAGGFVYIAGSDLIPELQQEASISTSIWQFILIVAGIGIMVLLK